MKLVEAIIKPKISEVSLKETRLESECKIAKELNRETKDTLHETLKQKLPEATEIELKKIKGNIGENFMDSHFQKQNWKKIEGEYGVNGIDGLYKQYQNGTIHQVMVAESKYGGSRLGDTKDGKQMSKEWILSKLDTLQEKYPDNKDYATIKKMVENDCYKTRLVNVKEIDNKLSIHFTKIDKEGSIKELNSRETPKVNGLKIDLNNPKTDFEAKTIESYNKIVDSEIQRYKDNGNSPYPKH